MLNYLKNLLKKDFKSVEYEEIRELVSELGDAKIVELTDKDLVFSLGDPGKNAYLILEGQILLLVPEESTSKFSKLILNKGLFFGEKSLVMDIRTAATAIAHGKVKLLVIPGDKLLESYDKKPKLRHLIDTLKNVYDIPLQGTVERFLSYEPERERAIIDLYKTESGRTIRSTYFIDQHLFHMHLEEGKGYRFEEGPNFIEIEIKDHRLVSLKAKGFHDKLPALCRALLNQNILEPKNIESFTQKGELDLPHMLTKEAASKIICECMSVTWGEMQCYIDQGNQDLESLKKVSGACMTCRGCAPKILKLLGINPWLRATIETSFTHNKDVRSFFIKPLNAPFKQFQPGQYLLIQVKFKNKSYTRPYSISDTLKEGGIRITVKKEENGIVSDWLFNINESVAEIDVTQPEGEFILNTDVGVPILCFAGGIGITPFMVYVKTIAQSKSHQRIHIHYNARSEEDFIFREEFGQIGHPYFSISRSTKKLTAEEIRQVSEQLINPEIYICGSEKYVNFVASTLVDQGFLPNKIHYEKYIFAWY